jgi:hypothetical protein
VIRAALCLLLISSPAIADSPLTSIDFSEAYADLQITHAPREKQLAFLTQQSAPSGEKLAVASALGWGQQNAPVFVELISRLRPNDISASDELVAGWLLARDDYLELKAKGLEGLTAQQLLDKAAKALPDDFAVQYARALVRAQGVMSTSWCDVFKITDAVVKQFPPAKRNLRPAAVEAAQGYLHAYSEDCPGSPEQMAKATNALNQIYTVSKLGKQIVTATQAGVVVWQPENTKPVATHSGFICSGLMHESAVFIGCEGEVLKWDGRAFTSYLTRTQGKNTSEYYKPMRGPDGALWVRLGSKVWLYDASVDRFQRVTAPWKGDPYDALVRKNGETWSIDMLSAIVLNGQRIPIRSEKYPGGDPRRFDEDARGTLWVEDFEQGLFRYDDKTRVFVRDSGISSKGSGVGWDSQGRLVMLHYTDGVTVLPGPARKVIQVRLPELQYMRDLYVDAESGDIWVAGWTGLMRLRPDGDAFGKQLFEVQ